MRTDPIDTLSTGFLKFLLRQKVMPSPTSGQTTRQRPLQDNQTPAPGPAALRRGKTDGGAQYRIDGAQPVNAPNALKEKYKSYVAWLQGNQRQHEVGARESGSSRCPRNMRLSFRLPSVEIHRGSLWRQVNVRFGLGAVI